MSNSIQGRAGERNGACLLPFLLPLPLLLHVAGGCTADPARADGPGSDASLPHSDGGADDGPVDGVDGADGDSSDGGDGFCAHGSLQPCGFDEGVCFATQQRCVLGQWETCPGLFRQGPEVCDALDNDCDGATDEDFGVGAACTVGLGLCARTGTTVCTADRGVGCSVEPGPAGVEVCDGLDNDCDGVVDEHQPKGQPCTVGVGACARDGVIDCSPELGLFCAAEPGDPGTELCGNEADDDCDGETDEGFQLGEPCELPIDGCRLPGRIACGEDRLSARCRISHADYPPALPPGVAPCAPILLRAHACSRQIELRWLPVPGAQGYWVMLGESPGPPYSTTFATSSPGATLVGLENERTYHVRVATMLDGSARTHSPELQAIPTPQRGETVDSAEELYVPAGATYTLDGAHAYTERVLVEGTLCVTPAMGRVGETAGWLQLFAPEIEIGPDAALVASARGFPGGGEGGEEAGQHSGGGGAHGGDGGSGGDCGAAGGRSYAGIDEAHRMSRGSGGAGWQNGDGPGGGVAPRVPRCGALGAAAGGAGGGALALEASGLVTVHGALLARGGRGAFGRSGTSRGGGGAGGGILLAAPDVRLLGLILLDGGDGGGGGGGGRLELRSPAVLQQGFVELRGGSGLGQGSAGAEGVVVRP